MSKVKKNQYEFEAFCQAYRHLLHQVHDQPEFVSSPRGKKIKENLNVVFTINDPRMNLYKNKTRSSPVSYICDELIWYLSGSLSPKYIGKRAALWDRITNPNGTINSNYGNLALYRTNPSQFYWAYNSLVLDKDSRQALMNYNGIANCQFEGVKDFVCTLSSIFHIREDLLHMTTTMRSNDIIFGLPADLVWFTIVHQQMFKHLKKVYPNLEMGSYTHIAHSLHLYEQHFDLVENMFKADFLNSYLPPLEEDLFDEFGRLTQNVYFMVRRAMLGEAFEFNTDDKLINFIYDNSTKIEA